MARLFPRDDDLGKRGHDTYRHDMTPHKRMMRRVMRRLTGRRPRRR